VKLPPDLNPILDEGAPNSTGGIEEATALCDQLGRELTLDPPRAQYMHGWGTNAAEARPVTCTWTLVVRDIRGKPTAIPFDLVSGSSPLIVGLHIKRHSDTINRDEQSFITFQRPSDAEKRTFNTYIAPDATGNDRLRMELIPHERKTTSSFLAVQNKRMTFRRCTALRMPRQMK